MLKVSMSAQLQVLRSVLLTLIVLQAAIFVTAADFELTKVGGKKLEMDWPYRKASSEDRQPTANPTINLDLTTVRDTVSEQFLSVTIDSCAIKYHWDMINFTSVRTQNLAKALSPAMLRIGGTDEDFLLFKSGRKDKDDPPMDDPVVGSPPSYNCFPKVYTNFTLSEDQWDEVNSFVAQAGWEIIFGLNVLLRHPWPNGSWDSTNAKELMSYTATKGYKVNWELGNGR